VGGKERKEKGSFFARDKLAILIRIAHPQTAVQGGGREMYQLRGGRGSWDSSQNY